MSHTPPSSPRPGHILALLRSYPKRWLLPAVVVLASAVLYAAAWPETWEATQALIIRNEAANNDQHAGRFSHVDEMKTVQETILELARSRGVLEAVLQEVGPPPTHRAADSLWPDARDVEDLRDRVKLVPPKGAEFGETEIFYLRVRAGGRERAEALVAALTRQLETRFQQLRDAKAQSMIAELVGAVAIARADLAESTARLSAIETQVGSDLAELRVLDDATSGESALRRTATEIRNELRQAQITLNSNEELSAVLESARLAPERLVATPNQLLDSQPALRRLKEGLIDAQLRTAQLEGAMSAGHPLVQAAEQAEQEVIRHLHEELATAVAAIQVDLRLNGDRIALLEKQLADVAGKLGSLAELRAGYSNLVDETRNRAQLLQRAEQKLTEARVSQATAETASLIGRIDGPDAGADPLGPSAAVVLLVGLVGGLAAGFGTRPC